MRKLDVNWVREQFPALKQLVNGQPAVFLDGPAGTQVPHPVIAAINGYLETSNANTCGAFEDNRLDYVFDHPDRFARAGSIGIVFGAGEPCMTRPATDGGHFLARAAAFPESAPPLCRP